MIHAREALVVPRHGDFKGSLLKHPCNNRVCAAIPHFDTVEPLRACVDLLRNQTERPHILIVDTGSPRRVCEKLEQVFPEGDVEIHYMRAHGWTHASEPVAAALDWAQAICRSPLLFHTHADCFLRDRKFLERYTKVCSHRNPVIGYRMSPRAGTDEWEWMVSHTATLLYMPTIHRCGATWSYQRVHALGYDSTLLPGWPDTETGFNNALRDAGIEPSFIGDDINLKRQTDAQIDHVRSYAGSSMYHAEYHAKAKEWMKEALSEARKRVRQWAAMNLAESVRAPYERKTSPRPCCSTTP